MSFYLDELFATETAFVLWNNKDDRHGAKLI